MKFIKDNAIDIIIALVLIALSLGMNFGLMKLNKGFNEYLVILLFTYIAVFALDIKFSVPSVLLIFILNLLFRKNLNFDMRTLMIFIEVVFGFAIGYISHKKFNISYIFSLLVSIVISKILSYIIALIIANAAHIYNIDRIIKVNLVASLLSITACLVIVPLLVYTKENFTYL
ncbi:hypothetical protein [Fenollaria massiliensis]|uniref:Uncharacterized protein n=1 Tax=Fenollaria massiliensis TaxID=938288 RepID=A0A9E7DK57_9FIRM|nr:hypothetical protein [Fenollaria massiliensis]UQK59718.1 hypothetical protein M1R53_03490 [Fenollaria massiliensis]